MNDVAVREDEAVGSNEKPRTASASFLSTPPLRAAAYLTHVDSHHRRIDPLRCRNDSARICVKEVKVILIFIRSRLLHRCRFVCQIQYMCHMPSSIVS